MSDHETADMAPEQAEHGGDAPTSPQIYMEISDEGIEEMGRPSVSLFWSAIAAGLLVSFSFIVKAALYAETSGLPFGHAIDSLGYTIGFILVIFCRLQLFTENTITPVLPTIAEPTPKNIWNTGRVWGISLVGNFIGTATMAALFAFTPIITPSTFDAMMSISEKVADLGFTQSLVRGLPSGLLIASLVWMRPSSGNSFLGLVFLIIYVIALGDFTHVIVGSCEIFLLAWEGERAIAPMMLNNILPTLIGNIIGGTALFALLAWAQVKDEL